MKCEGHMFYPSNYREVSMGVDKEGNWAIRGYFYADSANGEQEYPGHTQWTQGYMWIMGRQQWLTKGKEIILPPMKQSEEARSRHVSFDDEPDYIIADNMPENMTTKAVPDLLRVQLGPDQGK